MTQHSDKLWRDKMNEASIEDLVDSFDEEGIWQQINKENSAPATVKRLYGMQYWPYAAVLILGLMLGFYFDNKREVEVLSAQRSISIQTGKDTVFVATPSTAIAPPLSSSSVKKISRIKKKIIVDKGSANRNELPIAEERKTSNPEPEKELAVVRKKEIRVVYFEDMEAEQKLLTATSEKKSKRKLLQVNMPQSKDATTQELPLRSLVYAINQ